MLLRTFVTMRFLLSCWILLRLFRCSLLNFCNLLGGLKRGNLRQPTLSVYLLLDHILTPELLQPVTKFYRIVVRPTLPCEAGLCLCSSWPKQFKRKNQAFVFPFYRETFQGLLQTYICKVNQEPERVRNMCDFQIYTIQVWSTSSKCVRTHVQQKDFFCAFFKNLLCSM